MCRFSGVVVLLVASALPHTQATQQFVSVKGRLLCGSAPAVGVQVALYDMDTAPDPDDLLDQTHTDIYGDFALSGSTDEETDIEPLLKVSHDCDDDMNAGLRVAKFNIPYAYVTPLGVPDSRYELGTVNLETRFHDEERQLDSPKLRRHSYPRRLNYENDDDFFDGF